MSSTKPILSFQERFKKHKELNMPHLKEEVAKIGENNFGFTKNYNANF